VSQGLLEKKRPSATTKSLNHVSSQRCRTGENDNVGAKRNHIVNRAGYFHTGPCDILTGHHEEFGIRPKLSKHI
jgi:hypothetical protein